MQDSSTHVGHAGGVGGDVTGESLGLAPIRTTVARGTDADDVVKLVQRLVLEKVLDRAEEKAPKGAQSSGQAAEMTVVA